jgi:hypothetical protein
MTGIDPALHDLEVDIGGIPMPWWLVSMPDQVTTISWEDEDGNRVAAFRFEAFILASGTFRVHCTQPGCRWSHPVYDEDVMTEHTEEHM